MWGDNTCGECGNKQVNDNGIEVSVLCTKYNEELFLYTFLGIYMDAVKCNECI